MGYYYYHGLSCQIFYIFIMLVNNKKLIQNEITICKNIDESRGHYVKWNKSDREKHVLYGLTYMGKLKKKKKSPKQNRNRLIENKLMVAEGELVKHEWKKLHFMSSQEKLYWVTD